MRQITTLMRHFIAVADAGSFSAAASKVGISQSNVSKQVAMLEEHLTTQLFHRTTRSLKLTDDGATFYESALSALAAIDEAEASVGRKGDLAGIVRLTSPLTLAENRIIPMLPKFFAQYPGVEIDLTLSDHTLNLAADNLDLAVRVGRLGDDKLDARQIGVARRVMVASPSFLDRVGRPNSLEQLRDLDCIAYALAAAGRQWTFENGASIIARGHLTADSPHALRAAALSGLGIVINATWLFESDLKEGLLEEVLPEVRPISMPVNIMLPKGRHIAARTRALSEFLALEFAADPLLAL